MQAEKIHRKVSRIITTTKYGLLLIVSFIVVPNFFEGGAVQLTKRNDSRLNLPTTTQELQDQFIEKFEAVNLVGSSTLPTQFGGYRGRRKFDDIKFLVIHHTASSPNKLISQLNQEHLEANPAIGKKRWPAIGYHIIISQEGRIFVTNNFNTVTYGAENINTKSLHVSLIGNFDNNPTPRAQLSALEQVIDWLDMCKHFDIVSTHTYFAAMYGNGETGCAGKFLNEELLQRGKLFKRCMVEGVETLTETAINEAYRMVDFDFSELDNLGEVMYGRTVELTLND